MAAHNHQLPWTRTSLNRRWLMFNVKNDRCWSAIYNRMKLKLLNGNQPRFVVLFFFSEPNFVLFSILFCFYSRTLLELIFCSVCGVSDMQHAPCRSVILWWWFRGQLYSLLLEPELLIPFSWSIPATWSCLPFLWAESFFFARAVSSCW